MESTWNGMEYNRGRGVGGRNLNSMMTKGMEPDDKRRDEDWLDPFELFVTS